MTELKYDAEYASEVMKEIPLGYINKSVCGCGLTTLALENKISTVIVVPTIYLAVNKASQYPNERCDYNILNVWGDTTKKEIDFYVENNDLLKIMCTYDSLPKVEHLLKDCKLVIDECNELRKLYKGTRHQAAHNLLTIAEKYKDNVSFISATPLDLKYLPDWVSDIPQVTLNWENTVKSEPILFKRTYPFKSLINEILIPLKEKNDLDIANKTFNSVIVFLNSVNKIKEVIKLSEINLKDCRIICGDNLKNDVTIAGIERYNPDSKCKYLFVTSSGFCGIDIYMDNAMTVVVSNTSKNWQMVDLLTDLKQAVSRQRCKDNPNYGSYIYIYNQSIFSKTEEELLSDLEGVKSNLNDAVDLYNYAVDNNKLKGFTMSNDFIAYSKENGDYRILDENAFKADLYFILETRNQYTKGFDIGTALGKTIEVEASIVYKKSTTYIDLVKYFRKNNVNGMINWGEYKKESEWTTLIQQSYKLYKNTWLDFTYANKMVDSYGDEYEIVKSRISKLFKCNEAYTRKEVTVRLQKLYDEINLNRKAVYSDVKEVFVTQDKVVRGERMIIMIKILK